MKKAVYKFVYNRKNKLNSEGKALVQLVVYIRKRKYITTGVMLKPEEWNASAEEVTTEHPNYRQLRSRLRKLMNDITDYEFDLNRSGREMTITDIENWMERSNSSDFIEFARKELEENRQRKSSTYRAIKSKLKIIEEFGKLKTFSDITYSNIVNLDNWLRRKGKANATVFKYHQVIQYYIKYAVPKGLFKLDANPYLQFKPKKPKKAKRKFLDAKELRSIEIKQFSTNRLNKVRDIFLFSCYTGLSYSDIAELTTSHIKIDETGQEWLVKERFKNDNEFRVPVIPRAKLIMDKYISNQKKIFPIASNQRTNEYLKEIGDLCKIEQHLTFHMARHTFATTVTLKEGIPLETVSKMLGHSKIQTTQIYAKIVDEKIKNDMGKLLK